MRNLANVKQKWENMALIGIYLFVNSKEGEGRKSKVFDLFIRIHMQLLTLSATKQEAQNQ